ncbi:hypothetical protein [Tenacibaculum xiamenense]|uniref:hypothetical protein n=1 Tax=Tenacibaculum xiamenense TaxID=1261553 RepID=UPI00389677DA
MEKIIVLKNEYSSLDGLLEFIKERSTFECYKEYDRWENRTDANGQMSKCIVLKKNAMHAVKIHFINEKNIKLAYIIPNPVMNAFFGKSQKARKDIIEVVTGKIKELLLAPAQKKAFQELENSLDKVMI